MSKVLPLTVQNFYLKKKRSPVNVIGTWWRQSDEVGTGINGDFYSSIKTETLDKVRI